MKALRKLAEGYNQMALVEVNEVFPSDGELKLRVIYTGICGSDIHGFKGEYNKKIPLTLGHEFVGEVVDIGHSSSLYKVGDIVVSETTFETCEKCSYCNEREYNLCSDRKGLGTQVDGSFADFVLVKEKRCHLIPKEIDNKIAAMLEPLACCIHAVKEKTIVSPNEKIVVFGPGPIGILLATVLVSLNIEVLLVGTARDEKRLALAKELGIAHTLIVQKDDVEAFVQTWTNGIGADQIFECSGSIHAVHQAMQIIKKKGTIIQEGLFATTMNEINMDDLIHKEICYVGSRTQKPSSWKSAIQWLVDTNMDLSPIVTAILPLDEWEAAFRLAMNGEELKILMKP
jgi:L-iditol 2-dehydrogenase